MTINYLIKNGKAWSNGNNSEVFLEGHLTIDGPYNSETDPNGDIKHTYNILNSEITIISSGEIIASGSGTIKILFIKTDSGHDNMSEWDCGQISTSLVEGDVMFYDTTETPLGIEHYDKLPTGIRLNNGICFNKYDSINFRLKSG